MGRPVVGVRSSVTIRSVVEFSRDLLSALDEGGDVVLDLAGLDELDLSFVQAVEAARRQMRDSGRDIRLLRPAEGPLVALLERAGFITDPDAIGFWFHGDLPR